MLVRSQYDTLRLAGSQQFSLNIDFDCGIIRLVTIFESMAGNDVSHQPLPVSLANLLDLSAAVGIHKRIPRLFC